MDKRNLELEKDLKRAIIGIVTLCIIIGSSVWIYFLYVNHITPQIFYYDIKLGMSKAEVLYIKGIPNSVLDEAKDKKLKGFKLIIPTKEIEKNKTFRDFNYWEYELSSYRSEDITISFDQSTGKVIKISCYSNGYSCTSILGIYTGTLEEKIIDKLGKPENSELTGINKKLSYPSINLFFYLEKQKVYKYNMGISKN